MRTTLCWNCDNATGLCRWSHELKPIKGWKAKRTKRKSQDTLIRYKVFACPCFKPDHNHSAVTAEKAIKRNIKLLNLWRNNGGKKK